MSFGSTGGGGYFLQWTIRGSLGGSAQTGTFCQDVGIWKGKGFTIWSIPQGCRSFIWEYRGGGGVLPTVDYEGIIGRLCPNVYLLSGYRYIKG